MNLRKPRSWTKVPQGLVAFGCAMILMPGEGLLLAQSTTPAPAATATAASATPAAPAATTTPADPADEKFPPEKLDSLVAPIALYPDSLLAQALVASTYPLEIVQLQQWLVKNKDLKDQALTDAAAKQPWDPAIQSMAAIPDMVKRLADDIQWTTELGNAFLAQQSDVMDAVQRMRHKATGTGALVTNEQQKVETKVIEEKTVIIVEQANPEVIYVPSYNPTVVYGPPPYYYSYPPVYYPPPGYAFMSFSVGVAVGAAFWGGGCGWGNNDVNIDIDRNTNINGGDRNNINGGDRGNGGNRANSTSRGSGGKSSWSHNPQHRGAAPYSNKSTANKFSGSTRAQSGGANRVSATQQSLSGANRSAGAGAGGSRASSAGASASSRSSSAGSRSSSAGGNNIGSRSMPSSSSRSGGFSGGSSGFSGSSTRASSSRGASSMGGRGGGGGRRR
jgi:Protein of unknown function (DUF3300)